MVKAPFLAAVLVLSAFAGSVAAGDFPLAPTIVIKKLPSELALNGQRIELQITNTGSDALAVEVTVQSKHNGEWLDSMYSIADRGGKEEMIVGIRSKKPTRIEWKYLEQANVFRPRSDRQYRFLVRVFKHGEVSPFAEVPSSEFRLILPSSK